MTRTATQWWSYVLSSTLSILMLSCCNTYRAIHMRGEIAIPYLLGEVGIFIWTISHPSFSWRRVPKIMTCIMRRNVSTHKYGWKCWDFFSGTGCKQNKIVGMKWVGFCRTVLNHLVSYRKCRICSSNSSANKLLLSRPTPHYMHPLRAKPEGHRRRQPEVLSSRSCASAGVVNRDRRAPFGGRRRRRRSKRQTGGYSGDP